MWLLITFLIMLPIGYALFEYDETATTIHANTWLFPTQCDDANWNSACAGNANTFHYWDGTFETSSDIVGAIYQIRTSTDGYTNISVPSSCISGSTVRLQVSQRDIGSDYIDVVCNGGQIWQGSALWGFGGSFFESAIWWNLGENISLILDNCSTFGNNTLNISFYTNPTTKTSVSGNITIDCTNYISFDDTFSSTSDIGYCLVNNTVSLSGCSITTNYNNAIWSDEQIENSVTLSNDTTYYNYTVASIQLNFSEVVWGYITDEGEYQSTFFNGSLGTWQSEQFADGRVSFHFAKTGQTLGQFYEFENNGENIIDVNLTAIDYGVNNTDRVDVTIETQGVWSDVLSNAIVRVYELTQDNESLLVSQLYGEAYKTIGLHVDGEYKVIATLDNYVQRGGFTKFSGYEQDGQIITIRMLSLDELEDTNIQSIPMGRNVRAGDDITIFGNGTTEIQTVQVKWYINNTDLQTFNYNSYSTDFTATRTMTSGDGSHQVYVYFDDTLIRQFNFVETEVTEYLSGLEDIRSDKGAFIVFILFIIAVAGSIQARFKNYGIQSFTGLCLVFSFANWYILAIALVTTGGLLAKRIIGDEQ